MHYAYRNFHSPCLLPLLLSLFHGQDHQSKALNYGSHYELLELVDRLVLLTKTIFALHL